MSQQWKFQGTSSPVRSMDWTEGTFGLDWPGLLGPSVPSGLDWLAERYRRLGLARNLRSRPVQSRTKPVQSGRTGFGLDRQISDHDLLPLLSTPFHCPPLIQVNYFPRIIQPLPEILKPLSAKLRLSLLYRIMLFRVLGLFGNYWRRGSKLDFIKSRTGKPSI
jgi:hypothetical protein